MQGADGPEPVLDEEKEPTKRRGLSTYMIVRNRMLAAAKEQKRGTLTPDDIAEVRRAARQAWISMDDDILQQVYDDWRTSGDPVLAGVVGEPYIPLWGGGHPSTPLTADELHAYWSTHGWPSDSMVFHDKSTHVPAGQTDGMFSHCKNYQLVGCDRSILGICPHSIADKRKFDLIHKGLWNHMDLMKRDIAESGEVMMVIDQGAGEAASFHRVVFVVADSTWSPHGLGIIKHTFVRAGTNPTESCSSPARWSWTKHFAVYQISFKCLIGSHPESSWRSCSRISRGP